MSLKIIFNKINYKNKKDIKMLSILIRYTIYEKQQNQLIKKLYENKIKNSINGAIILRLLAIILMQINFNCLQIIAIKNCDFIIINKFAKAIKLNSCKSKRNFLYFNRLRRSSSHVPVDKDGIRMICNESDYYIESD